MNRLKPPPSQRSETIDWKSAVDQGTRELFQISQAQTPLKGATAFRSFVIGQIRIALDTEVSSEDLYFDIQGKQHVSISEGFRLILQGAGFDWRTPSRAESVMVVAQRAVDDEIAKLVEHNKNTGPNPTTGQPWTWQEQLAYVVGLALSVERHADEATAEFGVWEAFEESMSAHPTGQYVSVRSIPRSDGSVIVNEELASTPALFRLVLELHDRNWYEPENRAMAEAVICEILAAELPTKSK